jgi:signal transduction histidine kinase
MRRLLLHPAVRISLLYLAIAGTWVFVSDQLLGALVVHDEALLVSLSSIKGFLFVVVMAALLYFERRSDERANRAASEALRLAEHNYRAIFETAPVGIFCASLDERYQEVNSSFAQMLGYASTQEMIGLEDKPPGGYDPTVLSNPGKVSTYERQYQRRDGGNIDALVSILFRPNGPGTSPCMEGFVQDITERKTLDCKVTEQQEVLRDYAHQLLRSQEEERYRLSHELHDDPLQDLVALSQRVELARGALPRGPETLAPRLDELQKMTLATIGKLRDVCNALRPSVLEEQGIVAAVQAVGDELAQQMPHCKVHYDIQGTLRRLDPDVELTAFRIMQQAARNVRSHAPGARNVHFSLRFNHSHLFASVQDDGPGFSVTDPQVLLRQGHLGIAGMYERAALVGGNVTITSTPQAGTTVQMQLPYHL